MDSSHKNAIQLCQITGLLRVQNSQYELVDTTGHSPNMGNIRQKVIGKQLSEQMLVQNLNQVGFKVRGRRYLVGKVLL